MSTEAAMNQIKQLRLARGLSLDDLKSGIDALAFPGFPGVPPRTGPFVLIPAIGAALR